MRAEATKTALGPSGSRPHRSGAPVLGVPDVSDCSRGQASADLPGDQRAAEGEGGHRGFLWVMIERRLGKILSLADSVRSAKGGRNPAPGALRKTFSARIVLSA